MIQEFSQIFFSFNFLQIPLHKSMRLFIFFSLYLIYLVLINVPHTRAGETNRFKSEITPHLTLAKIKKSKFFVLPLECTLNENCWIMNYVDMGVNDDKQTDPACFSRTYNDHKGTDFAILDGETMKKGVNVLAPLDGTIIKIRDNEPDQWSTPAQLQAIRDARKECGNAIMIDHGDDLQTIYCHLKKDSITVRANQKVKTGDKLAQVGLSGLTEFPHLHFGIMQDKKVIDPFTGQNNEGQCGTRVKSLWDKHSNVSYQPVSIQSSGFLDSIPHLDQLEKNQTPVEIINNNADVFTFWTVLLGVREGDEITLEIKDQNGKLFTDNKIIQPKTRAQQFYYIGKKIKNKKLEEGAYTGFVKVTRKTKKGIDIVQDKFISVLVTK